MARVLENNKYAPGNATKLTNLVKHRINLCKNCIFGGHAAGSDFRCCFPRLLRPTMPERVVRHRGVAQLLLPGAVAPGHQRSWWVSGL